uniref:zinc finger protein CONSTANS-like n=1 Tax=Erigeron canadensis TaxID=72917 RepID=UPI001CB8BB6D|nr:zinc finger protein CONSTANS-like [Erigeron canadensis]
MKKRCELCKSRARIHCDSDRASLCWTCDARVHSANFLVARHSRILLCQICQSFTPWRASGDKLCPSTASICATCVVEGHVPNINEDLIDVLNDSEHSLSQSSSLFQPPPLTSSSSSDEILTRDRTVLVKRKRRKVRDLNREYVKDSSSAKSNSTPSASGTTFENIKRIRNRNRSFDDNITVEEEVHGNCKSATMLDLDLNASP